MLSTIGFFTLLLIILLLISKKVSVHFALVVPPITGAFIAGFSYLEIGKFAGEGITKIAPTGIMLTFSVLFFGVLFAAGMFDPIIKLVLRVAGGDPVKIAIGTAIIASIIHLDGSGSITFLITVSAMLPIYKELKMNPLVLAICAGLAAGVMNLLPWGGPTIRAATALDIEVMELFKPMVIWIAAGSITVYVMAYFLGKSERKRLGITKNFKYISPETDSKVEAIKRPKMIIPNLLMVILAVLIMLLTKIPLVVIFLVFTPIALMVNYPDPKKQQDRIKELAPTALYTATVIFSAGVFTGIFSGTGMIEGMAASISRLIPASLGSSMPVITGALSPIIHLFLDPDSVYYGILPVLSVAASASGVEPVAMGRALLMGQHIFAVMPLTGASWLLCSLCDVDMGDLQKKIIPLGYIIIAVFIITGLAFSII